MMYPLKRRTPPMARTRSKVREKGMNIPTSPVVTGRFFSDCVTVDACQALTESKQASEQPRTHAGEVILRHNQ